MNILCCLNTNFLNPLIVLMHSLRQHHKAGDVNLFLLSTDFSEKAYATLQEHCQQLDINLWFKIHKLKNFSARLSFTVDTYLRVFAFSLLPQNVDKVLYMDADMLLLDDVQKIYDIDVSNVKLAAVPDKFCDSNGIKRICKKQNINHTYFNAGMCLMNLQNIRKDWTDQLVCETAQNHELVWLDQDLLNILCAKDEIKILDERYNYQSRHRRVKVNTKGVILLHYVGKPKPWEVTKPKPHEKLWWEVALPLQLEGVKHIDLLKLKR